MQPIEKIRNILFEEIDSFRKGNGDVDRVKAISEISAQTVYTIRVELENKRLEIDLAKRKEADKKWMGKDFTDISTAGREI